MDSNEKSLVSILTKQTNITPFSIRFNLDCSDRGGYLKARVVAGLTLRLMALIQKGVIKKKTKKIACRLVSLINDTKEFDVIVHTSTTENNNQGGII